MSKQYRVKIYDTGKPIAELLDDDTDNLLRKTKQFFREKY